MSKTTSVKKVYDLSAIGEEKEVKIIIKKLPLGRYKQLLDIVNKIMAGPLKMVIKDKGVEDVDEFIANMQPEDLLELLPEVISYAIDEVSGILELATDKDSEFIQENVGLDDALAILEIAFEVNNIEGVVEKGKNLTERLGLTEILVGKPGA